MSDEQIIHAPHEPVVLQATATLRVTTSRKEGLEVESGDPEHALWGLISQGMAMLDNARRSVPYGVSSPEAAVVIETEHYEISIRWRRNKSR